MARMKLVVIESPFAGRGETPEARATAEARNRRYLTACIRDSLKRGEAPFASHAIYPGALDDSISQERELGIAAGFEWRLVADLTAVYTDLGMSSGMEAGILDAKRIGCRIDERSLGPDWDK